jgi:hypothetical protein
VGPLFSLKQASLDKILQENQSTKLLSTKGIPVQTETSQREIICARREFERHREKKHVYSEPGFHLFHVKYVLNIRLKQHCTVH